MKIRIACSDAAFPLMEHDDCLRLIGMLGVEGVDIGLFEERSKLQPSDVFGAPEKNGRALKAKAEESGLSVADVFFQPALDFRKFSINRPDEDVRRQSREDFQRTLEYALAAESYHLTFLPGVHHEGESYEDSLARASEELAWRVERAADAKISFGVEAHVGSLAETPEKILALLEMTPGLMLTLDYTHFMRQGIANEDVHPLLPYASHFHARGAAPGRLQTTVAENGIDYSAIAAGLKEAGYPGFIGLEYTWTEWEGCNRTDNLSETILLRDLLRALI